MLFLQKKQKGLLKDVKRRAKSRRPMKIDLSESMRVIESDPALTTREIANKLRRTHGVIHYQFKQLRLVSKFGQWISHGNISQIRNKKRIDSSQ